jgi:hypothetical protein
MRKLVKTVSLTLLLVAAPVAADNLTGKWSGSFNITSSDGETKDARVSMDLKQNGTELTGTAGPSPEEQWPILKGKVEGNKLTFEVREKGENDAPLLKFELTLVDGHLKGEAKAEHEGKSMKAAIDMQRKAE